MKERKVPMRMCSGCGISRPKKELVRVVRSPQGQISIDFSGKKPGRGAYICPSLDCLKKARKAKRFEKSFETPIPEEVFDALESELVKGE